MKHLYRQSILFTLCSIFCTVGLAQVDQLTEEDIMAIRREADHRMDDYQQLMNDLANPRIDVAYRDFIISESFTPNSSKQVFSDSAYIEVDYEPDYAPPYTPKGKLVSDYLGHFTLSYLKNSDVAQARVYFSNRVISDVQWNEEGQYYYLTVRFNSYYTGLRSFERRATLRADRVGENWKVLILTILFNYKEDQTQAEKETPLPEDPKWLVLARNGEEALMNNKLEEGEDLLSQSIALNPAAYNYKLLGRYHEMLEQWPEALNAYETSKGYGIQEDPTYQDTETDESMARVQEKIDAQKADSLQAAAGSDSLLSDEVAGKIELNRLAGGGKKGKTYTIHWELPTENPVSVMLMRGNKPQTTLRKEYYSDHMDWTVSKKTRPGGYQLQVLDEQQQTSIISPRFRISRRFPLGLQVGLAAGVAYLVAAKIAVWPPFQETDPGPVNEDILPGRPDAPD